MFFCQVFDFQSLVAGAVGIIWNVFATESVINHTSMGYSHRLPNWLPHRQFVVLQATKIVFILYYCIVLLKFAQ